MRHGGSRNFPGGGSKAVSEFTGSGERTQFVLGDFQTNRVG